MTKQQRLEAANKLLATTPYKPVLYETQQGLRLFINRIGSSFANVDIPALVNYDNMFFMRSKYSVKRPNLPWGSTQERMITTLVTWVNEAPAWKYRPDYWDEMVQEHGHWLNARAVAKFQHTVAEAGVELEMPAPIGPDPYATQTLVQAAMP